MAHDLCGDAVWRVVMHHEPEPNDEVYVYATDAHHALTHGQEVYDALHPGNKLGAIYAELARHETSEGSNTHGA